MEKLHYKPYPGTPFSIEISTVENTPGTWNSNKVSIYKDDTLIGEYLRNYHSYTALTFVPFMHKNEWYALYSPHYTATRVLKLHNDRIEDWCGEEPNSYGFCPVEYYVPRYKQHEFDAEKYPGEYCYYIETEYKTDTEFINIKNVPQDIYYTDFAFMCGCVWGDDSSWKLRFIDLSKIDAKILSITDKFGYWQMPANLSLKECIDMSNWEPDHNWVRLTRAENFNLTTDERC